MKNQFQFATLFSVIATVTFSAVAIAETTRAGAILTADLAQQILGGPVKPSSTNLDPDEKNGATWVSRSHYTGAPRGGSTPTIGILIRHAASVKEAKNIFSSSKSMFHGVDVAGFGDAAYRTKLPAQLNVLKGANWIIVNCGLGSTPDTAGQEKLAKAVLLKVTD